ncbi:MAG: hypothetical protein FJ096_09825 [Deltaproteobacteria bacterium]|nr:hypothetical protein [Deltaproteobacteria bacterium]
MRSLLACGAALLALFAGRPGSITPSRSFVSEASAAVSIAYTLEQLVAESPTVQLVEVAERRSAWALVGGSRRIVTYTRLRRLASIRGETTEEVWVRTLGGVVDRIGQQVTGEAVFTAGERAVVFLTRAVDGVWVVTGMGQGHYPIRPDRARGDELRLAASPLVGELLKRRAQSETAHARLVGAAVDEAIAAIRATKGSTNDAPR